MKAKIWCEAIAYVLVGVGGFSFVSNHSDLAYGLTLAAGGIDKFGPRLFGGKEIIEPENQAVKKLLLHICVTYICFEPSNRLRG